MKSGKLELIIGPMYASKTTELIKIANRFSSIDKNIVAINHKINDRYGTCNIMSHDQKELKECLILENLNDLVTNYNNLYKNADIILIEELQFFNDAYDFITNATDNDNKIIIAAGLDGDSNRQPFGDVLKLIPIAEKVTKLSALCHKCGDGTLAHFTKRISNNKDKLLVGSQNDYIATCRFHYFN